MERGHEDLVASRNGATAPTRRPGNPHVAGNPVGGSAAFVGREDVLRAVVRALAEPLNQGIVLYGQRRIGKTSILQHLVTVLPGRSGHRPVWFDLQDKAAESLDEVLADLASAIATAIGLPEPTPGPDVETWFSDTWLPTVLGGLPAGVSLVLLFDEFDVLADVQAKQAASALFPYLRRLLEKNAPSLRAVFVIGRNIDDLENVAHALFKGLPACHVSLLSRKDAEALVRLSEVNASLTWSDEAVEAAWTLTHGHPLLLQALCSHVWVHAHEERRPEDAARAVTAAEVEEAVEPTLSGSRAAFEWLWKGLPPGKRIVAAALAQAGPEAISEKALHGVLHENGVRVIIRELREAPRMLIEWDLVEAPEKGLYQFRVELLRRWISRYKPLDHVQQDLDQIEPTAELLYRAAEAMYRKGSLDSAMARLQETLGLNPNHVRASELLADIRISRQEWGEARTLLERLYEDQPAVARARLVQVLLALAEAAQGDDEQLRLFQQVRDIESDATAIAGIRRIWQARGDKARARGDLKGALEAYRAGGVAQQEAEVTLELQEKKRARGIGADSADVPLLPDSSDDPHSERPPCFRTRLLGLPDVSTDGLRAAQIHAVRNLEVSLRENRPRALIHMAPGTGKTVAAITSIYRLIEHADASRVLFLVDRADLGRHAFKQFQQFTVPDDGRKFTELYNVQWLDSNKLDKVARVVIATIQRLYSMLKGNPDLALKAEEPGRAGLRETIVDPVPAAHNPALPVDAFDVIFVDECHRSIYSSWGQVLEYFDAFLVGLTATPDQRTFAFFNQNLVTEYGHAQAVADGVNVDFDVYRIRTSITEKGSTVDAGPQELLSQRARETRHERWQRLDEEITDDTSALDQQVVAVDQIRTVLHTFHDRLFTEIFPGRREVPKTLIFAQNDSHANEIVKVVREEFGKGNDFCEKISYKPTQVTAEKLLSSFRNSYNPRVLVSVDMIAAGMDVKALEIVMFLRAVKSRSLFERMKGLGARTIDPTDLQAVTPDAPCKDRFVLVDCVGVCETDIVDAMPLEKNRRVSVEKLLDAVARGSTNADVLSSLAGRLARLYRRIGGEDRDTLAQLAGGRTLADLASNLVSALDVDAQMDRARAAVELPPDVKPPANVLAKVTKQMLRDAAAPLRNSPELRKALGSIELGALSVAVPPQCEQRRTVVNIEQHLSYVDAGMTALERALQNLKMYRASVLNAACEGKLVPTEAELVQQEEGPYEAAGVLLQRILTERRQRWHQGKRKGIYEEPRGPNMGDLPSVPEGWVWVRLEQVCDVDVPILHGAILPVSNVADGIPYIRNADISDNGTIALGSVKRITPEIAANHKRASVCAGDIMLSIAGVIDKVCIIPPELDGAIITQSSARIRAVSMVSAAYLRMALLSPQIRRQCERYRSGNAVQRMNVKHTRDLTIPLPPLAEQHRIVTEVDRLFSVADATEAVVRAQLVRGEWLRQAVLKRAFDGQVVHQDLADELASAHRDVIRTAADSSRTRRPSSGRMRAK